MAQKRINELQLISAPTTSLMLPGDNGIQTYRTTLAQIKELFLGVSAANDGLVLKSVAANASGFGYGYAVNEPTWIDNISIAVSVASNALTVAIKDSAGNNHSATSRGRLAVRSATITSGAYSILESTGAQSLTIPTTATLGSASAVPATYYVYEINNAGTLEPAISMTRFDESQIISTTAISAGSTSSTVMYSTTARTNVAFRLIDAFKMTQATAGTWATAASYVSGFPIRLPKPKFSAWKNASQAVAVATPVKVTFASTELDNMSAWDASNNRYVIQEPGDYLFNLTMYIENLSDARSRILLYVNGTQAKLSYQYGGTAGMSLSMNALIPSLVPGDYVEVYIDSDGDTAYSVYGNASDGMQYTYFSGSKVE